LGSVESLFTGKNHIVYKVTDSTNTRMKELLQSSNPLEGTIISAEFQNSGRGQRGANWESEPGQNILLSILYYPRFLRANEQVSLSQAIALGVLNFVRCFIEERIVKIKWPNDIYVDDKKIAGILIENVIEGNTIKSSIIGVGVNINQKSLLESACSIFSISGQKYEIVEMITALSSFIEIQYLKLRTLSSSSFTSTWDTKLHSEYLANLYGQGLEKKFTDVKTNESFGGVIENVSQSGKLQIRQGDILKEYDIKEISMEL
jgi:BirA family biotin operon repressor/biotin-[acetyl-CoA-carboxylase] ligase